MPESREVVLVTGGSCFIGSALVDALAKQTFSLRIPGFSVMHRSRT